MEKIIAIGRYLVGERFEWKKNFHQLNTVQLH